MRVNGYEWKGGRNRPLGVILWIKRNYLLMDHRQTLLPCPFRKVRIIVHCRLGYSQNSKVPPVNAFYHLLNKL